MSKPVWRRLWLAVPLVLMFILSSCDPFGYLLPEEAEAPDKYTRRFIGQIFRGHPDSSIAMLSPQAATKEMKSEVFALSQKMKGQTLEAIRGVRCEINSTSSNGSVPVTEYIFTHECVLKGRGNMFFYTNVGKANNSYVIQAFQIEDL